MPSTWPQAEQATLAAAAYDPGFCATVLDAGAEVFTHPDSQRAWHVLQQLVSAGHVIDQAALEAALGTSLRAAPSTDYWPILLEQRLQRQLQLLGRWLTKPRDHVSPTAIAARAMQSLNQALNATQRGTVLSGAEAAQAGLEALAAGPSCWLASGIPLWDAVAARWGPDDLVLLAARPSQGKTALGLQMAWHTARSGRGVAFCSVEMAPAAIGTRALCQRTGWSEEELSARLLDPQLEQALQDLSRWPWRVMDANGSSVADLQAAVARADLTGPRCDVVVVDYLQIVHPTGRPVSREQEVTHIAEELKRWARRDHRLIVALAQLSRKVEERVDHRPVLSDLRESGALEQIADAVAFIYREPEGDAAELLLAKNRNGPTGSIPVMWQGATVRFASR